MDEGAVLFANEPILSVTALPDSLKGLEQGEEYPVEVSPAIRRLAEEVDSKQV